MTVLPEDYVEWVSFKMEMIARFYERSARGPSSAYRWMPSPLRTTPNGESLFYPTVLLDKSAFEALSHAEYRLFSTFFHFQVLPPILVMEIVADLTKEDRSASTPEALVQRLARRFGGTGPPAHVGLRGASASDPVGDAIAEALGASSPPCSASVPPHGLHTDGRLTCGVGMMLRRLLAVPVRPHDARLRADRREGWHPYIPHGTR